MKDQFKVTGRVVAVLLGPDGKEKERREINNLVVTAGKNFIASRMVGTSDAVMSHMAVGTGSTAPAAGNTSLATQLGSRVALSGSSRTGSAIDYTATFAPGVATGGLQEAGIFNAASSGTLLCRTTFAIINKGALDALVFTWTVTIS